MIIWTTRKLFKTNDRKWLNINNIEPFTIVGFQGLGAVEMYNCEFKRLYAGEDLKAVALKYGKDLEVVKRPAGRIRIYNEQWRAEWIPVQRGFTVLPRRWVVERTFAWIGRYRRMLQVQQ